MLKCYRQITWAQQIHTVVFLSIVLSHLVSTGFAVTSNQRVQSSLYALRDVNADVRIVTLRYLSKFSEPLGEKDASLLIDAVRPFLDNQDAEISSLAELAIASIWKSSAIKPAKPQFAVQRALAVSNLLSRQAVSNPETHEVIRNCIETFNHYGPDAITSANSLLPFLDAGSPFEAVASEAFSKFAKNGNSSTAIKILESLITDKVASKRLFAARLFGSFGRSALASCELLIGILNKPEEEDIKCEVISALGRIALNDISSAERVRVALQVNLMPDTPDALRSSSVLALGRLAPILKLYEIDFVSLLMDQNPTIVESLMDGIQHGRPVSSRFATMSYELFSSGIDIPTRLRAMRALAAIGPDAAKKIHNLDQEIVSSILTTKDPILLSEYVTTLHSIGASSSLPANTIVELLKNPDKDLLDATCLLIKSLGDLESRSLLGLLIEEINYSEHSGRTQTANQRIHFIRGLASIRVSTESIISSLCALISSNAATKDREQAIAAVSSMGQLAASAIGTLSRCLTDPQPELQLASLKALLNLGQLKGKEASAVVKCLSSASGAVRSKALDVLTRTVTIDAPDLIEVLILARHFGQIQLPQVAVQTQIAAYFCSNDISNAHLFINLFGISYRKTQKEHVPTALIAERFEKLGPMLKMGLASDSLQGEVFDYVIDSLESSASKENIDLVLEYRNLISHFSKLDGRRLDSLVTKLSGPSALAEFCKTYWLALIGATFAVLLGVLYLINPQAILVLYNPSMSGLSESIPSWLGGKFFGVLLQSGARTIVTDKVIDSWLDSNIAGKLDYWHKYFPNRAVYSPNPVLAFTLKDEKPFDLNALRVLFARRIVKLGICGSDKMDNTKLLFSLLVSLSKCESSNKILGHKTMPIILSYPELDTSKTLDELMNLIRREVQSALDLSVPPEMGLLKQLLIRKRVTVVLENVPEAADGVSAYALLRNAECPINCLIVTAARRPSSSGIDLWLRVSQA